HHFAAGIAAPSSEQVKSLQRRLVARHEQDRGRAAIVVCVFEPGAAGQRQGSNCCQSKRLPSTIECPLPSNDATRRLAVCRIGCVFSPGRNICTKNVMVLNTGPPVSGSTYSIDSAS